MVRGFAILLLCQLAGEVIARGLGLPVPGPVLGLALLVLGLCGWARYRPLPIEALQASGLGRVSEGLLASLALMFVPAGVGVIQYLGLISAHGLALALAIVGSTVATLLTTVGTFLLVKRWRGAPAGPVEP